MFFFVKVAVLICNCISMRRVKPNVVAVELPRNPS